MRRGACGLTPPDPKFLWVGGEPREIRGFPAKAARILSALRLSEPSPCQRRRRTALALLSAMVFALWQPWHRLCRLFSSVNFAQSPSCGTM